MKVFPPEVVDAVIAECGRTEKRRRRLPARSVAYFAMGMALHSDGSYEDVLALISDGLAWADRVEGSPRLANKAAISHARDRLGPEPMEKLFDRVAVPLANEDAPGCWLAGRRLVAVDGTCLDLADTPANDGYFGRPGVSKGEKSAFPQARVVALAECGTHAIFDAVIGPYTTSENALTGDLLDRGLGAGMLCLADRGFYSFGAWQKAVKTGGGPALASQGQPGAGLGRRSARRVISGRGVPLGQRPPAPASRDGQSDRVHDRRRARTCRPVPPDHHDPGPPRCFSDRTGRRLRPAVGDRVGLR